jgi:hypothetical protein
MTFKSAESISDFNDCQPGFLIDHAGISRQSVSHKEFPSSPHRLQPRTPLPRVQEVDLELLLVRRRDARRFDAFSVCFAIWMGLRGRRVWRVLVFHFVPWRNAMPDTSGSTQSLADVVSQRFDFLRPTGKADFFDRLSAVRQRRPRTITIPMEVARSGQWTGVRSESGRCSGVCGFQSLPEDRQRLFRLTCGPIDCHVCSLGRSLPRDPSIHCHCALCKGWIIWTDCLRNGAASISRVTRSVP